MSVADSIKTTMEYLSDAYNAFAELGVEMSEHKNFENLPNMAESISQNIPMEV